jgi:hypothetical protein
MTLLRSVGIALWLVTASATANAQPPFIQPFVPSSPFPSAPADSTVIRTYPGGEYVPSQRLESRTRSNGVELVTSVIERPDVEGRLRPSVETTTETVRVGPNAVHTRHDVFTFDQSGRRMLVETTQSEEETRTDGSIDVVRNTFSPGVSGDVTLTAREIEHTRTAGPGAKETDTAIYRPGSNQALVETERVHQTERQAGPGLVRKETTRFMQDGNGRFQATETRSQDVRSVGPTDYREEETIQRPDATGKLSVDERNVVRRTIVDGREHTTVETFSAEGRPGSGNLQLNRRTQRTTTIAADGSGRTDEEVEGRALFAPGEPLRLMQRSTSTIRNVGGQYLEMQRQLLERDVNHLLVPSVTETGVAAPAH